MRHLLITAFLFLLISNKASAKEVNGSDTKCGEKIIGKVLKVEDVESPLFMKFNGDEIESHKIYVAIIPEKNERRIAQQILKTFKIHSAYRTR